MQIIAPGNNSFKLVRPNGAAAGELCYQNHLLHMGTISAGQQLLLENTATGIWKSFTTRGASPKNYAEMKVSAGSTITLKMAGRKSKYRFKRTGGWKTRFVLLNKDSEEVMALLPRINWLKQTHDFVLQLNDEFEAECTPVLILHTVHCACCSLNMLNGSVPALINV